MTTAGTFERGGFWASAGAGLLAGLLIVVLVFRLTSSDESSAPAPAAKTPAITVLETTADAGTDVAAADPAADAAPDQTADQSGSPDEPAVVPATTQPLETAEASVNIARSIGPCKFGPACLIASFTISGFASQPAEFVCEFQDGSRYTFSFSGDGSTNACSTGTVPGSIVVEVDGVRSKTITNP